jgi:hypothetical protein
MTAFLSGFITAVALLWSSHRRRRRDLDAYAKFILRTRADQERQAMDAADMGVRWRWERDSKVTVN